MEASSGREWRGALTLYVPSCWVLDLSWCATTFQHLLHPLSHGLLSWTGQSHSRRRLNPAANFPQRRRKCGRKKQCFPHQLAHACCRYPCPMKKNMEESLIPSKTSLFVRLFFKALKWSTNLLETRHAYTAAITAPLEIEKSCEIFPSVAHSRHAHLRPWLSGWTASTLVQLLAGRANASPAHPGRKEPEVNQTLQKGLSDEHQTTLNPRGLQGTSSSWFVEEKGPHRHPGVHLPPFIRCWWSDPRIPCPSQPAAPSRRFKMLYMKVYNSVRVGQSALLGRFITSTYWWERNDGVRSPKDSRILYPFAVHVLVGWGNECNAQPLGCSGHNLLACVSAFDCSTWILQNVPSAPLYHVICWRDFSYAKVENSSM